MTERVPKGLLLAALMFVPVLLAYMAYSHPAYFANETYLGALVALEVLIAAVWMYKRVFFTVVMVSFLFAGANLPVGLGWTAARWLSLGVGAVFGLFIVIKERRYHFDLFHLVAFFAVLTALLSATVSRYPQVALLKVLSVLLLFVYAATGARVAVIGRENVFFARLLLGCEIFIGLIALFYGAGIEAMGNPNSLGAVMGIVGSPLMLWGMLVAEDRWLRQRRGVFFGIALLLGFLSHSRAGLAAAFVSCGLLCLMLRKYRLMFQGMVIITIVLAGTAIFRPEVVTSLTSSVIYKGGTREQGILASRESPWLDAINNIRDHPWFGLGLGTTADVGDPNQGQASFSSTSTVSTEHGSSYLAIAAGVGMIGFVPFAGLLITLGLRVGRTLNWVRKYGVAAHPAVPLAVVILAGMVHAAFEDWMFAVGSYLSVFFWALAFVFIDESSSMKPPGPVFDWRSERQSFVSNAAAPSL